MAGSCGKKVAPPYQRYQKESGWDTIEKEVNEVRHDVKDAVKQGDISEELRETKKSVEKTADEFKHDTESK